MSTESRHTPGPWTPDAELTPSDPGASALQCRFFYGPNGLAIFRMGLGYERAEVDEANARLISQAPAMLEALKDCQRLLVRLVEPDMRESPAHVYADCRAAELKARAAITAAQPSEVANG